MATFIIMPKLGMTMETGVITKWLKHEGDAVRKGEAVFELETDKLNTVAEAPADGMLKKILVPEGTEVAILKEVAVLAAPEEDISAMVGGDGTPAP
ncbi:MAG: biotin/lipoyl-containing protein, partial [Bacillota bacterium]